MTRLTNFITDLWDLDALVDIINKVNAYVSVFADENTKADVTDIEDNTYADKANKRYDITVKYFKKGHYIQQKLLYLKGELIDGEEFHRRYKEFYP